MPSFRPKTHLFFPHPQANLCNDCVGKLLAWREQALTAGLAAGMAAAAAGGGAKAASAYFDDNLDTVVGWGQRAALSINFRGTEGQ